MKFGVIGVIASFFIVFVLAIFGAFTHVEDGNMGVYSRAGAIQGVVEPGFVTKIPFLDTVRMISVQDKAKVYENVEAYSRDQQLATLTVSVNYRILPGSVEQVIRQYGGEEGVVSRVIDRRVNELVKTVFGQFNAATAIQDRGRLNAEVGSAVQNAVNSDTSVVFVESVQIEDVAFSAIYEQSIEARMLAEVEVQKREQELAQQRVQAEITVTQAQAEADAQVARATAQAQATILAGEAEAEAIRAKGEALRENPQLVDLITAEQWNGSLPNTFVPGSAVPFLNVNPGGTISPNQSLTNSNNN